MTKAKERKAMHVQVSRAVHKEWHDFASENGVSVSALIEILPRLFDSSAMKPIVEQGRTLDATRRQRQDTNGA